MGSKCTPGPWHLADPINEHKSSSTWTVPVWADNGPEVGKIAAEAIAPTREMARANARLIVASKELLAFARHFFEWHAENFEDFEDETNMQLLCLANEAEAAIAEVEGK